MPLYSYEHPKTGKKIDIVQSVNDRHEYVDEKGVKWDRVFHSPQVAADTEIDPLNSKDFAEKTGKKKGTLGNIYDCSREASLKREQIVGKDPVKEKWKEDWSKKRRGTKFPDFLTRD